MLESVKVARRQSEIRAALSALVGKDKPTDDEVRSMSEMDKEYQQNETRYRAALIAEDHERRDAGKDLETRDGKQWADLVQKFEVRQAVMALDEGAPLSGATQEVVTELRAKGGYRGVPIPWAALEKRAGETIASGTPDPVRTMPIIDRIFAESVAVKMGASMVNIDSGAIEYPVTTSSVAAGWAASETGAVAGPTVWGSTDRALKPEQTLGIQMKLTRKAMKQSGDGLEQAVRRDMNGCIGEALDKAVFLGSGASGEPLGVVAGAATYVIDVNTINAAATWSVFRDAAVEFLNANAASSPDQLRLLVRNEVWAKLDGTLITNTAVSEWDRLKANISSVYMTANALVAPAGGPPVESSALMTVLTGGVPPIFVGLWGGIDLIRDPFSDAASGMLRLTALVTADVQISRVQQLRVLAELQT